MFVLIRNDDRRLENDPVLFDSSNRNPLNLVNHNLDSPSEVEPFVFSTWYDFLDYIHNIKNTKTKKMPDFKMMLEKETPCLHFRVLIANKLAFKKRG